MSEVEFRQAIAVSNQDPIPRDIVLRVWLGEQGADAVLQRLYREMEMLAPLLARDRRVVRLEFEGRGIDRLPQVARADLEESLARHFSLCSLPRQGAMESADPAGHCDVLGMGPGALSSFGPVTAMNTADPEAYCHALDQGRLPVVKLLTNSNPRR